MVKTGEIFGFAVIKMPAKGALAQIGRTIDERPKKFQGPLVAIKHCFKEDITFKCDSNISYNK